MTNMGNPSLAPPPRGPMRSPPIPESHGPPPPAVKTKMCNKYNTAEGCKFGDKCHFAHGEWALGKPILPSHDGPMVLPPMGPGRMGGRVQPPPPPANFGASATAKISVDASLAGAIIGKGGVNTKHICHVTGAKLATSVSTSLMRTSGTSSLREILIRSVTLVPWYGSLS